MMLALIFAQLVQSWPWLDSPLVQPGPTICVGECAGPVVWGPAERGRLVVACDMKSDTCSDGRKITTTRATPVPCETSPGVWTEVGVNQGCYSVRGLESWAATTSYLSFGAELDRSPWSALRGGTIEALADGYRVTSAAGEAGVSGRIQVLSAQPEEGPVTLSCIVRTQQPIGRLTLEAGTGVARHFAPFDTAGKWERVSVSGAIAAGAARWAGVGPRNTDLTPASVDVKACWYTYTSTPGRPCWGGEAPVTCAADQHTISTEGWPTESGSISVAFKFEEFSEAFSIILDARTAPSSGFNIHYDRSNGRLVHRQGSRLLLGPTVETGKPYFVELRRKGPKVEMLLNGVLVASDDDWEPWSYSPIAVLGKHFDPSNVLYVNGSISSLAVRSYEEVSP